jgi:hypothetical protein
MNTASNAAPKFELSAVQLIAGCLAAVTAAVLASFFGVAGTIVGTALGSIVGTAGTAIYSHSIRRTRSRLHGLASHDEAHSRPTWMHLTRANWLTIGVAAAIAFVIALAFITGVEARVHRTLAAVVAGKSDGNGTTSVGTFTGLDTQASPAGTTAPTSNPSPVTPVTAPTATPSTEQPTPSPASTPIPTPSPSTRPQAPAPS